MVQLLQQQHKALPLEHRIPQRLFCFLVEFPDQITEGWDCMKIRTKKHKRQTELRRARDVFVIDQALGLSASRRQARILVPFRLGCSNV